MLYEIKKIFLVVSLLMAGLVTLFLIVWFVTPNEDNKKSVDSPTPTLVKVSLQDIINKHGFPEYVRASIKLGPDIHKMEQGITFPILFIYLEKGFAVGCKVHGSHITADIQIDSTNSFVPKIENLLKLSLLFDWPYIT